MVKRVDALRAQRLMARKVQFLDVLPNSIFVQEHLPGARSQPLESLNRSSVSDLDPNRALVVYCFDQH